MKFEVTIGKFQNDRAEIKAFGRRVGWLACAANPAGTGDSYAITLTERFSGVILKSPVASPAEAKKELEQSVNRTWKQFTEEFAVAQRRRHVEATLETGDALHG